jgi:branched-subunit amino acid aminotransferase/4-amino-4-deoxychorismate lyase
VTRPPTGPGASDEAHARSSNPWLPPGARPPERTVWVNGHLLRGGEAALSLFDRGARDGGGLFETVRVYGGRPCDWNRHMERLVLGAALLGFPVPSAPSRLHDALAQVLAAEGLSDAVARLTVTRGVAGGRPTRTGAWVEAEPLAGRLWHGTLRGAGSAILSRRPFHPGPLGAFKTTSRLAYDLAREEARAAGVDEVLMIGEDDRLYEGAVSNVFVVIDGTALTPPLAHGILPGVVRARVLEQCAALGRPAREKALARADLGRAEEVFVTNSVQEVLPLARIGERELPSRSFGERVREAYRERLALGEA